MTASSTIPTSASTTKGKRGRARWPDRSTDGDNLALGCDRRHRPDFAEAERQKWVNLRHERFVPAGPLNPIENP